MCAGTEDTVLEQQVRYEGEKWDTLPILPGIPDHS